MRPEDKGPVRENARQAHTRRRATIPAADAQVKMPSTTAQALHTPACRRQRFQPYRWNFAAASLTRAIGSGGEPGCRRIQLTKLGLGVGDQRQNFGPLECDRRPLRIVLIVIGGPLRPFDDRCQFASKRSKSMLDPQALRPERLREVRHRTSRHRSVRSAKDHQRGRPDGPDPSGVRYLPTRWYTPALTPMPRPEYSVGASASADEVNEPFAPCSPFRRRASSRHRCERPPPGSTG